MSSSRNEPWFNWARAIAVSAIVYVDVQRKLFADGVSGFGLGFHLTDSVLNSFLYPLCIFLSGYAYTYIKALRADRGFYFFLIDKLLYTFILWTVLQGLIAALFSGYTGSSRIFSDIYFELFFEPSTHLWIFPALILCYAAADFLDRSFKLEGVPLLLVLAISIGCYLLKTNLPEIYPIRYLYHYFVYFLSGYIFFRYLPLIRRHDKSFLAGSLLTAVICQYGFHGLLKLESYADNNLLLPLALSSIFALLGGLISLGNLRLSFLGLIGRASMLIFVTHGIFASGTREFLINSVGITNAGFLLTTSVLISLSAGLGIYLGGKWIPIIFLATELPRSLSSKNLLHFLNKVLISNMYLRYATYSGLVLLCSAPFLLELLVDQKLDQLRVPPYTTQFSLTSDPEAIAEGERLARIYGCYIGCHGNLAGGVLSRSPSEGINAAPNLTISIEKYSTSELDGIIRQGVWPDGRPMTGGMPSAAFNAMGNEQLIQILSFIKQAPKLGNSQTKSMMGVRSKVDLLRGNTELEVDKIAAAKNKFGNLPLESASHQSLARSACSECHGSTLSGDPEIGTPHLAIARAYSLEQFNTLLRTGTKLSGEPARLMSLVAQTRFSFLTDEEMEAIYGYLTTML